MTGSQLNRLNRPVRPVLISIRKSSIVVREASVKTSFQSLPLSSSPNNSSTFLPSFYNSFAPTPQSICPVKLFRSRSLSCHLFDPKSFLCRSLLSMASSLTIKRLVSSNLVPSSFRLIRPSAGIQPAPRSFNTNALRQVEDQEVDRRTDGSLYRRGDDFFTDVVNPISPSRSLGQMLAMMDQLINNSFPSVSRGIGDGIRGNWDARETDDALNLRIDMPGLDKEDVKVLVEQNTLTVKGERAKETDDEESGRRYGGRIQLPEKMFKLDQIKAEMKNGVLRVVVPKVKADEKENVFHVNVQ